MRNWLVVINVSRTAPIVQYLKATTFPAAKREAVDVVAETLLSLHMSTMQQELPKPAQEALLTSLKDGIVLGTHYYLTQEGSDPDSEGGNTD